MEIRVPHQLTPEAVAERVRGASRRHGLAVPEGSAALPLSGEVEKETPLGTVRAHWRAEPDALIVTVLEKPAFLPDGTVRHALEDGLREALAS